LRTGKFCRPLGASVQRPPPRTAGSVDRKRGPADLRSAGSLGCAFTAWFAILEARHPRARTNRDKRHAAAADWRGRGQRQTLYAYIGQ